MSQFPVATRLRFVLVGTQHPGNMGAAARALKTMGLARLVLVAPEKPLDEEAFRRSAGAEDVLGDAPVVATLAEAVADCRLVLGCTARARRVQLEEYLPADAAARAVAKASEGAEVALVFGRERTGLTNEELQLCHAAVHIPSDRSWSATTPISTSASSTRRWRGPDTSAIRSIRSAYSTR